MKVATLKTETLQRILAAIDQEHETEEIPNPGMLEYDKLAVYESMPREELLTYLSKYCEKEITEQWRVTSLTPYLGDEYINFLFDTEELLAKDNQLEL